MLMWVYEAAAAAAHVDAVYIASGDARVIDLCRHHGMKCIQTYGCHASGTDRVAEAVEVLPQSHVINLQADEPSIPTDVLNSFAMALTASDADMLTLAAPAESTAANNDPNRVKVLCNAQGDAQIFSRRPIPNSAVAGGAVVSSRLHVGVYGFTRERLRLFTQLAPDPREDVEKLEQLRALYAGWRISVIETAWRGCGVDTPDDLTRVEALLLRRAS